MSDLVLDAVEPVPATTQRYAIVACGAVWRVLSQRALLGHFQRRSEAWATAVRLAREAEEAGHSVQLLAQDEDGDFAIRLIYSDCRIPARMTMDWAPPAEAAEPSREDEQPLLYLW